MAIRASSEVMADCSLEVSVGDVVVTTRVASESPSGRNGAPMRAACWLGELEGRNELLSVLTTLESGEKRPIVRTVAAIQNAITK